MTVSLRIRAMRVGACARLCIADLMCFQEGGETFLLQLSFTLLFPVIFGAVVGAGVFEIPAKTDGRCQTD